MTALKQIKTALILLLLLTILTGVIYPAIVTGVAQLLFPWRANGSLIAENHKIIGSLLLGQSFVSPQYFWGRPSATTPYPYNAANSSGSNLGPTNPALLAAVNARAANLRQSSTQNQTAPIPIDLVTASASGLDPDISPAAAFYQVPRIAKARNIPAADIQALIKKLMIPRVAGILGEPRVNVLQLNLALDKLTFEKVSR